ncbi:MAG: hypothetical protein JWO03_659 [Bacteroidetes bacterium]|nr:hypothetical protein [Bacteroidota bacterium]
MRKRIPLLLIAIVAICHTVWAQTITVTTTNTPSICYNDGSLTVNATGGTAPYIDSIISGPTNPNLTYPIALPSGQNHFINLPSGSFTVRVHDAAGHVTTVSASVAGNYQFPLMTLTTSGSKITATRTPGTGRSPVQYCISSTGPNSGFSAYQNADTFHACNGNHWVRMRDSCGNIYTDNVYVTYTMDIQVICINFDDSVSQALSVASGGVTPYTYYCNGTPNTFDGNFSHLYNIGNVLTFSVTDACGVSASKGTYSRPVPSYYASCPYDSTIKITNIQEAHFPPFIATCLNCSPVQVDTILGYTSGSGTVLTAFHNLQHGVSYLIRFVDACGTSRLDTVYSTPLEGMRARITSCSSIAFSFYSLHDGTTIPLSSMDSIAFRAYNGASAIWYHGNHTGEFTHIPNFGDSVIGYVHGGCEYRGLINLDFYNHRNYQLNACSSMHMDSTCSKTWTVMGLFDYPEKYSIIDTVNHTVMDEQPPGPSNGAVFKGLRPGHYTMVSDSGCSLPIDLPVIGSVPYTVTSYVNCQGRSVISIRSDINYYQRTDYCSPYDPTYNMRIYRNGILLYNDIISYNSTYTEFPTDTGLFTYKVYNINSHLGQYYDYNNTLQYMNLNTHWDSICPIDSGNFIVTHSTVPFPYVNAAYKCFGVSSGPPIFRIFGGSVPYTVEIRDIDTFQINSNTGTFPTNNLGVYNVITYDSCGISRSFTFSILDTCDPCGIVSTNSDTTICVGNPVTLTATAQHPGGTFLWSPGGQTTPTITVSPTTTTKYKVTYTASGCGPKTDSVTVNVLSTAVVVPDTTICSGSVTLRAAISLAGGSYLWSPGGQTTQSITVTPSSSSSYSVTYSKAGCASSSDTVRVTLAPLTLTPSPDTTICAGTSATLVCRPSQNGGQYQWAPYFYSPGGDYSSTYRPAVSSDTTFTVTYTKAGCIPVHDTIRVFTTPAPVLTITGDTSVCVGDTVRLHAQASITGGTYYWGWDNVSGQDVTYVVLYTGDTYHYLEYTLPGCGTVSWYNNIVITSPPTIAVNDTAVCTGSAVTLTARPLIPGGSYQWLPGGQTTQTIAIPPGSTASYIVSYKLGACPTVRDTARVTVESSPTLAPTDTGICTGASALLIPRPSQNGGTFLWSPGGQTTRNITVTPAVTSSYAVTFSKPGCPPVTDTATVIVAARATVVVPDTAICSGSPVTLTATPSLPGGTYTWAPTNLHTQSITVSPTVPTNYICFYNKPGCASTSDTGRVTVSASPTLNAPDGAVCSGSSTTLTATPSVGGGTYLWTPGGQTTQSITVSPASTSVYVVTYTKSGCQVARDSVTVTVATAPTVSVRDTATCAGASVTLTATPSAVGGTYLWSPGGQTTQSISVSPATSTTYSVTYTISGCTAATDTARITVSSAPVVTATDTAICSGSSVRLTATPSLSGGTYSWSPGGATTQSITVSPATSTNYIVSYTKPGCPAAKDTAHVNVASAPTVSVADTAVCSGSPVTLTASPSASGGSYSWLPGGQTTQSITVSPATTITYRVTYTIAGCTAATDTARVSVSAAPTVSAHDTAICAGTSLTLTATPSLPGGTYSWSPGGQTTQSITVSPTGNTNYIVSYTRSGCPSARDTASVTVASAPTVSVADTAICSGASTTLTASPSTSGGSFSWSPGGATTQSITVSPAISTTYRVNYTISGCTTATDTARVDVSTSPTVSATDTAVCAGASVILAATPSLAGGTYLWSPGGATTQSITVTLVSSAKYSVVYTRSGCSSIDTANVTVSAAPTVSVRDTTVCTGTSVTLTATPSSPGGTYIWSPGGATTQSITVSPSASASYSVTYSMPGCASATDSALITTVSPPTVTVSDTAICQGTSVTLTAAVSSGGGAYLWMPGGQTTQSITVSPSQTSTYAVTYTISGCTPATDSARVIVVPAPVVVVNDTSICGGVHAILIAVPSQAGGRFMWTPGGEASQSITVSPTINSIFVVGYNLPPCPTVYDTAHVWVSFPPVVIISYTHTGTAYQFTDSIISGSGPFSYVWNFGDGSPVSNATSPAHTYTQAGSYIVTMIITDACGSDTVTQIITVVTGIPAVDLNGQVAIYPNPNQGSFIISVSDLVPHMLTVDIIDMLGRSVYRQNIHSGENKLDLKLPSGIYTAKVSDGDKYTIKTMSIK